MGVLSRRLGISSAKLREACEKMNILVPPAHYWRSLKDGGAPSVPDLPPHEGPDSFEFDRRRKQSLVEWVIESQQPAQRTPNAAPTCRAAPAGPRYLPLKVWADQVFGEHQPHPNTLLRWVHEGRIQPPAKKIGRHYYVRPESDYLED
jgi:hypothetical protein